MKMNTRTASPKTNRPIPELKAFLIAACDWIADMRQLLIIHLRLAMAIKLADQKHFINDKRYWVLPEPRSRGLLVVHEREIKSYKKIGLIDRHKGAAELAQECFYRTSTYRGKKDGMSPEEKQTARARYIRWKKYLEPVATKARIGAPNIKKTAKKRYGK
jgi:hypothetical protein